MSRKTTPEPKWFIVDDKYVLGYCSINGQLVAALVLRDFGRAATGARAFDTEQEAKDHLKLLRESSKWPMFADTAYVRFWEK